MKMQIYDNKYKKYNGDVQQRVSENVHDSYLFLSLCV